MIRNIIKKIYLKENNKIIIYILISLLLSIFCVIFFSQHVSAQYVPPVLFGDDHSNLDNPENLVINNPHLKGLVNIDEFIRDGEGKGFDWLNDEISPNKVYDIINKEINSNKAPGLTYEKTILNLISEIEFVDKSLNLSNYNENYSFENYSLIENYLDLCLVLLPDLEGVSTDLFIKEIFGSVAPLIRISKDLISVGQIYKETKVNIEKISYAKYTKAFAKYLKLEIKVVTGNNNHAFYNPIITKNGLPRQAEIELISALQIRLKKEEEKNEILINTKNRFDYLKEKYFANLDIYSGLKKSFIANKREEVKELIFNLIKENQNLSEIAHKKKMEDMNQGENNTFNPAVAVIMDVSKSMDSHSKLGSAKKAINSFIDSQNENYYLSLAAYSTNAKSVVNPVSIARGEDELRKGIAFLSAAGNTNIGSGLTVGLNQLYSLNNNLNNSRMILLSDGKNNTGELWPVVKECIDILPARSLTLTNEDS